MSTLFLVRHGQASWLAADYDHLSELGRDQARRLGTRLAQRGVRPDAIFSGPRRRQRDTAAELAGAYAAAAGAAPPIEVLDELDEYPSDRVAAELGPRLAATDPALGAHLGRAASSDDRRERGRALERVLQVTLRAWSRGEPVDGAETWEEFEGRLGRALAALTAGEARGRSVVAVSSAGSIGALVGGVLGVDRDRKLELGWTLQNSALSELPFSAGRVGLGRFNALDHLDDPAHWTFR